MRLMCRPCTVYWVSGGDNWPFRSIPAGRRSRADIQPIPNIRTTPAIPYIAFSDYCLLHLEGYVGRVVDHFNRTCSGYGYGVAFRANHRCCHSRSGTPSRPTTTRLQPAPLEVRQLPQSVAYRLDARRRQRQEGECHRSQRSAEERLRTLRCLQVDGLDGQGGRR
jgi:hypothetical protein